jgi:zinc transport system substrate-binding protein
MSRILSAIMILAAASGCGGGKRASDTISVSILPQKYLVQRITGDLYNVAVMVPPGQSPESYEPTSLQMKEISRSLIYFRTGYIPFETSQMDRIAAVNPSMRVVDTSAGIDIIRSEPEEHGKGDAEKDEHHHHGGTDPHLWLSARNMKIAARTMLSALLEADPAHSAIFRENHKKLEDDIDRLDAGLSAKLNPLKGKSFLCFHPAWAYFARDYGLRQISIEFEGKDPSPAHLKKVIDLAGRENIRAIFIQKEFPAALAEALAKDINGKVLQLDPLSADWLDNMRAMGDAFFSELR